MRVKSLVAAASVAVAAAVMVVPGVSNASRGGGTVEPSVQPNVEVPVVEETPTPPVGEELPGEPVAEEAPALPVAEETPAAPEAKKLKRPVAPPPAEEPPVPPAVDPVPVVEVPAVPVAPQQAPAPAATKDKGKDKDKAPKADRGQKEKGACHMDSYESRDVASLNGDEAARAQKVDRNGNGTVCRKDIRGNGRGNTGQGSNIKDDQAP